MHCFGAHKTYLVIYLIASFCISYKQVLSLYFLSTSKVISSRRPHQTYRQQPAEKAIINELTQRYLHYSTTQAGTYQVMVGGKRYFYYSMIRRVLTAAWPIQICSCLCSLTSTGNKSKKLILTKKFQNLEPENYIRRNFWVTSRPTPCSASWSYLDKHFPGGTSHPPLLSLSAPL